MQGVESVLCESLGREVQLRRAVTPMSTSRLTDREVEQYQSIGSDRRRHHWLLGRTALKELLPVDEDTSPLVFPHPQLSISHAHGVAVAVRICGVAGAGVDLELASRHADPRTVRFFLHPDEQPADISPQRLLQLWTVKEALFKATPDNMATVLTDYRLHDAAASVGDATGPRGEQLRYVAVVVPDGFLTVAACLAGGSFDGPV